MNIQTIQPGQIEQTGIASILKTLLYTIAGAFLSIILATLYHFNFGGYEAIAMVIFPTIFKLIEKFFFKYNITVADPIDETQTYSAPTAIIDPMPEVQEN